MNGGGGDSEDTRGLNREGVFGIGSFPTLPPPHFLAGSSRMNNAKRVINAGKIQAVQAEPMKLSKRT